MTRSLSPPYSLIMLSPGCLTREEVNHHAMETLKLTPWFMRHTTPVSTPAPEVSLLCKHPSILWGAVGTPVETFLHPPTEDSYGTGVSASPEVTFCHSSVPPPQGCPHLYRFPSSPWGRPRPPNIHKVASGPSTIVCPRRCRKRLAVSWGWGADRRAQARSLPSGRLGTGSLGVVWGVELGE